MAAPIVPAVLIIGGGLTAIGGIATGAVGGMQIRAARVRIRRQAANHEDRYEKHLAAVQRTNDRLQDLGRRQERAQREVIDRMRDFLIRNAKQVRAHEHLILEGVSGARSPITTLSKQDVDVLGWVRGVVGATSAGIATPAALGAAVIKYASASTGTPISQLSGAAAEKARLAFLGGGSLDTGGGGMKLGKTASGVAAVGPALLMAGIALKTQGTKARTEADRHQTDVEVAIATFDARDELLRGVQQHASRLDDLLARMMAQTLDALNVLESEPFDISIHAEQFHTTLILVKSVRDIATAPVADEDGNLDAGSEHLVFTYRDTLKEPTHG